MANAVVYARYSSHSQRDASIEDQVRVCRDAAKRNGDRILRVYADRAKSGTEATARTEFLRMIADARKGAWTKVYVYKLDRFARNRYDSATYRHKLTEAGVSLVSATEPIGDNPESALLESVLEGFAEYYSRNLSANIRRGLDGNALHCGHNGVVVFGYDLGADGQYHVNKVEAKVVREAFDRFAAGQSATEIRDEFDRYRTKRGKKWTTARICGLLRNDKYIGTYRWKDLVVEDGMPAIVDKDLFAAVNARLGKRKKRGHSFPLSGLVYDTQGRRFVGTSGTGKRGTRYYYYWIPDTARRIRQDDLESCVYGAVADFLQMPGVEDRVVEGMLKARERMEGQYVTEADALEERLKQLDKEQDGLIDLSLRVGPSERIENRLRELQDEVDETKLRLADVKAAPKLIDEDVIRFFVHKIIECDAPDSAMRAFVTRVVVDDDELRITFSMGSREWLEGLESEPPITAGNEGCSHRYPLVDFILLDPNTSVAAGFLDFTLIVQVHIS